MTDSAFVSNFSKLVAADLKGAYPINLAGVNESEMAERLEAVVQTLFPRTIRLAETRPDYESALAQLMNAVERDGVWADADMSSTGQMILRAIATDIDFSQFSIGRALQEVYLDTARSDASIFRAARDLGNRLQRNRSAKVSVEFTRPDVTEPFTLPAYSQFTISVPGVRSYDFFIREPLTFLANQATVVIDLFEGVPTEDTVYSTGVAYQTVEIGQESRNISEDDLRVSVNNEPWLWTEDPLWEFGAEDKVWTDSTLPTGNIRIQFGNSMYGLAPAKDLPIKISWVENTGETANVALTGLKVTPARSISGYGTLQGVTLSTISGGKDAFSSRFYRLFASNTRAARKRSVRRSDYRVNTIDCPYVALADCHVVGQAEIAPTRPSFMNLVWVIALKRDGSALTEQEWKDLSKWIDDKGIYRAHLRRLDPKAIDLTIDADIYCSPGVILADVRDDLVKLITERLTPTFGTLGYSWYLSDIYSMLEGVVDGNITPLRNAIQYAIARKPTAQAECKGVREWVRLSSIKLNFFYSRREGYDGNRSTLSATLVADNNGVFLID